MGLSCLCTVNKPKTLVCLAKEGRFALKLDLRDMLATGARVLPFSYVLEPPADDSLSYGIFRDVSFPTPMTVEGEIINTAGYMRMTLTLSLQYVAPCSRCLCEVSDSFSLSLEKTVVTADVAQDMDEDSLDDCVTIEDGFLSIDEQLIDLLFMEFPSKILCSEDCKGLCAGCGANLNTDKCSCVPDVDPRLAPLQAILEQMKQDESK